MRLFVNIGPETLPYHCQTMAETQYCAAARLTELELCGYEGINESDCRGRLCCFHYPTERNNMSTCFQPKVTPIPPHSDAGLFIGVTVGVTVSVLFIVGGAYLSHKLTLHTLLLNERTRQHLQPDLEMEPISIVAAPFDERGSQRSSLTHEHSMNDLAYLNDLTNALDNPHTCQVDSQNDSKTNSSMPNHQEENNIETKTSNNTTSPNTLKNDNHVESETMAKQHKYPIDDESMLEGVDHDEIFDVYQRVTTLL